MPLADGRNFEVRCHAHDRGDFCVSADFVSVKLAQRLRRNGAQEMWQSVVLLAKEDNEGNLVIEVLVCNPEWDDPMRIASLKSRPHDADCLTGLGCNLDHVIP